MTMLIHEIIHFSLSLFVGTVFYFLFGDFQLVFISLLLGFLIDIDHFFDYFYWAKGWFNLKEFFNPCLYVKGTKKVFVLLHGWEYLLVMVVLIFATNGGLKISLSVLAVSYFLHMLFDQISSAGNIFSYSLIFRIINKFNLGAFRLKIKK